jgi:hypothetical protein
LVGANLPFFDPYGWTPEAGFDHALAVMGWTSTVVKGKGPEEALARLRAALKDGPVWVGPVEMGHLRHQPGKNGPIGADHYLVVLAVEDERVEMHDPQGFPYVSLPLDDFMTAWRAETIGYGSPFMMRIDFRQVEVVPEEEVIRRSIPAAIRWLAMGGANGVPAGSLGNGEAAERLAELVGSGCAPELRAHLIHFAVRVGARRAVDAATCLARVGYDGAARIMAHQARLIGALQHPLVVEDDAIAASQLRALAPTYEELQSAMETTYR